MGLFKKIGKALKKVAKVVKKVAPVALSIVPGVGGVASRVLSSGVGRAVSTGAKAASTLKSTGVNTAKASILSQMPMSTVGPAMKVARAVGGTTIARKRSSPKKKAAPKKKPAKKRATANAASAFADLFKQWKADDEGMTWQQYSERYG